MFAYRRTLIAILIVLIDIFVLYIARLVASNYNFTFWLNTAAVCFAVLCLGLSMMSLLKTNNNSKALPFLFVPLIIACGYFIFTLVIPLVCSPDISSNKLIALHCAGLIAAVVLYVFSGMAHRASIQHEDNRKQAFAARTFFRDEISSFKNLKAACLQQNAALNQKFLKVEDAFQYASDSVPESSDADSKIVEELKALNGSETPESIETSLDKLLSLAQRREDVIKNSR